MSLGESMMNWLRSVDKDQNLQGLTNLTNTSMTDRVRRWFRRQDLTPTLETGYYDSVAGQYELGPPDITNLPYRQTYAVLNTSAQDHDFVVTAGQTWEFTGYGTANISAGSQGQFRFSVDGGTTEHVVPGSQHPGSGVTADTNSAGSCNLVLTGVTTNVFVRCSAMTFAGGNVRSSTVTYRRLA